MITITLLQRPSEGTPKSQTDLYQLLERLGQGNHTLEELKAGLGLASFLPIKSRLQHLAERGVLKWVCN